MLLIWAWPTVCTVQQQLWANCLWIYGSLKIPFATFSATPSTFFTFGCFACLFSVHQIMELKQKQSKASDKTSSVTLLLVKVFRVFLISQMQPQQRYIWENSIFLKHNLLKNPSHKRGRERCLPPNHSFWNFINNFMPKWVWWVLKMFFSTKCFMGLIFYLKCSMWELQKWCHKFAHVLSLGGRVKGMGKT